MNKLNDNKTVIFENSSHICEIEYDVFLHTLSITFNSGKKYNYLNVEQDIFEEFKSAQSPGQFFHSKIKNKYEFFYNKVLND